MKNSEKIRLYAINKNNPLRKKYIEVYNVLAGKGSFSVLKKRFYCFKYKLKFEEKEKMINNLNNKYAALGYIHDNFEMLYNPSGVCGDYNENGNFICSADLMPLDEKQQKWCETKGNCMFCKILADKVNL